MHVSCANIEFVIYNGKVMQIDVIDSHAIVLKRVI